MDRERALRRVQKRLAERGWPRLQVSAAFLVAGLTALGTSYGLLSLGLSDMALRYAVSTCVAYGAFLLLLRFFVSALRRVSLDVDPGDAEDVADGTEALTEGASDVIAEIPIPDLDEGVALLVPLAVLCAGLFGAAYVIYVAPVLLAELILDIVIASSLARRFHRLPTERWYYGALRHTFGPFLGILVTVALAGFLAELIQPGADSIGDVFRGS